ncbi:MAG: MarR family winged helix-turn-helix transcriptional regulator [Candidatus Thiodiazotropha sp. (ex Codakia rugifera)]|nr:MarR family winged helix-turn-helix transcriptional regulator [Candidatus Thiodiazotropha sp. (ex Codakia rugifera)]
MSIDQLHTTLERLCNLLRVEAREHGAGNGLLPVQLEALHYLGECNRYSDSVQGVSEYLGQTKGTVSQTLKVLEKRGLVKKLPDSNDRRIVHLQTTAAGRKTLDKVVPALFLIEALKSTSEAKIGQLTEDLKEVLRAAQQARGAKSFGACITCRFNESVEGAFQCGLTGEKLTPKDTVKICREHLFPDVDCKVS